MIKRLFKILICLNLLLLISCEKKEEINNNNNINHGCDIIEDCVDNINIIGYNFSFKEEYEALNGLSTSSGAVHRTINISDNNPFLKVDPKEIINLLENKETFFLYVGDELCPWCRSVIEVAINMANEASIEKIYYIEIWDDEGKEIFRDQYKIEDNELVLSYEGSEEYKYLINAFSSVLNDYTLENNDEIIEVGEKRIYAPNFFYIENGVVKKFGTGISDKQVGSRDELTKEIIDDEEKFFDDFFNN